jgi:uncharacterized membrane protein YsdA (DUF1294 family)
MPGWLIPWLLFIAMNIAAFSGFGIDKGRARSGSRRISEKDLLLLALFGGTIGAYLGRSYFRHKTRKAGFSWSLHLIALAQIAFLIWVFMRP